jgi:hypothetical protein
LDRRQRCMARGGHGLPKVSLGPDRPDPSTPFKWATGRATCSRLLPFWTPHIVRLRSSSAKRFSVAVGFMLASITAVLMYDSLWMLRLPWLLLLATIVMTSTPEIRHGAYGSWGLLGVHEGITRPFHTPLFLGRLTPSRPNWGWRILSVNNLNTKFVLWVAACEA